MDELPIDDRPDDDYPDNDDDTSFTPMQNDSNFPSTSSSTPMKTSSGHWKVLKVLTRAL